MSIDAIKSTPVAAIQHSSQVAETLGTKVKGVALKVFAFLKEWGTVSSIVIGAVLLIHTMSAHPLASIAGIFTAVVLYRNRKSIELVTSLWMTMLKDFIGRKQHAWFHKVGENIIFGGIPLQGKNHPNKLKEEGVEAVLCVASKEEQSTDFWGIHPVKSETWKNMKIDYKEMLTEANKFLPLKDLDGAVEFIHHRALEGKKTYVYCGYGIDRSALVSACYLIKYNHLGPKEALELIKKERPSVKLSTEQLGRMHEYADYIAKQSASSL